MKVGDTFSSYEELNKVLAEYKKLVHNEYWIRDARTIENQRKRHPDTVNNANDLLRYYYLVIACIRGGRKFQSRNVNSKRNCSTSKQDCPAAIHLHMSKCKQYLTVKNINECHNHKTSLAYFSSSSQKRLKLWTKSYQEANRNKGINKIKEPEEEINNSTNVKILQQANSKTKRLTNLEKFKIMDEQCKIMSQMCSEVSKPVFYERLNLIKTIINKWSVGDFKLNNSISQDPNNIQTEEENECHPSTSTSDAGSIFSDPNDMPDKITSRHIKMHSRKRERPKGSGNTVIRLKKGKMNLNTKVSCLEILEKDHKGESLDSFLEEEYLENIDEEFQECNLDVLKEEHKENSSNQSLNEDYLEEFENMEEVYLEEDFLE